MDVTDGQEQTGISEEKYGSIQADVAMVNWPGNGYSHMFRVQCAIFPFGQIRWAGLQPNKLQLEPGLKQFNIPHISLILPISGKNLAADSYEDSITMYYSITMHYSVTM